MPLPSGPPPLVGILEYWKVPLPISLSVSLDPESAKMFWSLHKFYYQARPNKNYSLGPSMAGVSGIGGSVAGGGSGGSAASGGSGSSDADGGSGSSTGCTEWRGGLFGEGRDPWVKLDRTIKG